MASLYLKACPRCEGDLVEKVDMDGKFYSCLQCGYSRDLNTHAIVDRRVEGRRKRVAA